MNFNRGENTILIRLPHGPDGLGWFPKVFFMNSRRFHPVQSDTANPDPYLTYKNQQLQHNLHHKIRFREDIWALSCSALCNSTSRLNSALEMAVITGLSILERLIREIDS